MDALFRQLTIDATRPLSHLVIRLGIFWPARPYPECALCLLFHLKNFSAMAKPRRKCVLLNTWRSSEVVSSGGQVCSVRQRNVRRSIVIDGASPSRSKLLLTSFYHCDLRQKLSTSSSVCFEEACTIRYAHYIGRLVPFDNVYRWLKKQTNKSLYLRLDSRFAILSTLPDISGIVFSHNRTVLNNICCCILNTEMQLIR